MPLAIPFALILSLLFGVMAWLLPAYKVAAAMVGVAGIITVIRNPLWGLLLFAVVATFLPYTTVEVGIRTTISEALIMLIWASIMAHSLFGQSRSTFQKLPPERLLIAFMLFTTFPFVVGMIVINAEGNGPVNWVRWLFNLSTVFLVPRLLDTPRAREHLVIGLLLGTLATLLLSIPVYLKNGTATSITPILGSLGYGSTEAVEKVLGSFNNRMGSTWVHPNVTGGALILLLPLAACFGLSRKGWPRALGLAVTVLGGLGLLMTGSRGALISLIIVLLWLASKKVPYTGRVLMSALVVGALTLVLYPPLQDRVLALFSSTDVSTSVRFDEYANFPEAMARYPFGIGFKVDPPVPGSGLYGISNLWLNYVYKIGVLGMLFFCVVIWSWWKHVRPVNRSLTLTHDNALWLGTLTGVLAALVSGLFDHYFSFTTVLIALFWLMVGISLREAQRLAAPPAQPQLAAGSQP